MNVVSDISKHLDPPGDFPQIGTLSCEKNIDFQFDNFRNYLSGEFRAVKERADLF